MAPPAPPRFVDQHLAYLLGQAGHALYRRFEGVLRAAGLGFTAWRVLATLSGQPPMPLGQLAQEVLAQQPTVTKLVQRLAQEGQVLLLEDPQDLRRTLVCISPAGEALVAPLMRQAEALEAAALADFSPAEVATLKAQLRRLSA